MQFTTFLTTIALTAFSSLSAAQFTNQSHAFNLVVESTKNATLNGTRLTSCHTGAAIESLCTYPSDADSISQKFYYNYTVANNPRTGLITWNLAANGGELIVSEPLTLSYNPSSNVALPLFFPSSDNEVIVSFDKANYLYVVSDVDDSKVPAVEGTKLISSWFICDTYYSAYRYTTLAFVLGKGKPTNPTCQAVKVKRVALPKADGGSGDDATIDS